jgi:hypothetical protein
MKGEMALQEKAQDQKNTVQYYTTRQDKTT